MMLSILTLIGSVILGGLVVIYLTKFKKSLIKMLLAFSGGFLLSIAFNHFVPGLYENGGEQIGLYILLGFLVQLVLEFFSGGIEHGHSHTHEGARVPLAILISLSVHSFIEGIPLSSGQALEHAGHVHEGNTSLLMGILFHRFPVAIALMTLLLSSNLSKVKAWVYLLIFALTAPLGMWFGQTQLNTGFDFTMLMAIVVGMFLHISTTIIFETSENHKFNFVKLLAIVAGAALAILIH